MAFVFLFRQIRGIIATRVLRARSKSCGENVGAAKLPHIGTEVIFISLIMLVLMVLQQLDMAR